MIELPEAAVLSSQIRDHLIGKQIRSVVVLQSPHRFAWFSGDPQDYPARLGGKTITGAEPHGGMVRVRLGETSLVFHEGPSLRFGAEPESAPRKHQLLLEFADHSFLSASIRMYGGIACFEGDEWDSDLFRFARERPSPLTRGFTRRYLRSLRRVADVDKLTVKTFLATDQRIPGLGNGVLQDILFDARLHPKAKMSGISGDVLDRLADAIKRTLKKMVQAGGRDTERDLLGAWGGYRTILSRKTVGTPCPRCGTTIEKATYAGGAIYSCGSCQPAPVAAASS